MNIGVFLDCLHDRSLDDALAFVADAGAHSVEIGTFGEFVGFEYRLDELVGEEPKRKQLLARVHDAGLEIGALGCYGNPLHPDPTRAGAQRERFRKTVELASQLGVPTVAEFSGCPGDSPEARYPNWISTLALDDFAGILTWQWSERVVPYWEEAAAFCAERDVTVALEMFPGMVVYNPRTLLRLREAVGPAVGALFDPSHLIWQQVDIPGAVRLLGPAIHRVHMNDSQLRPHKLAEVGVVDATPGTTWRDRPWMHRTLGLGQGSAFWGTFIASLREIGYAGDLCVEQGDPLYDDADGIAKAIRLIESLAPAD
jgi:sugar phosphate isomerase/epimerase